MDYYPIFLDLKGKKVLVAGKKFADEKIPRLEKAGAKIVYKDSLRRSEITADYALVFGASGDSEINEKLARWCRAKRVLFNAVDDPKNCDFILPAVADRGKLVIAVSTSGASPYLATEIKKKILETFGPEYEKLTAEVAKLRPKILKKYPKFADRLDYWKKYFEGKLK
jgi:precorrin-2 dehydrogenase/sirohydrochlorin ferrochelatase